MSRSKTSRAYYDTLRLVQRRKGWSFIKFGDRLHRLGKWHSTQYKPTQLSVYQPTDYVWSHHPSIKSYGNLYMLRKRWKVANSSTTRMRWKCD